MSVRFEGVADWADLRSLPATRNGSFKLRSEPAYEKFELLIMRIEYIATAAQDTDTQPLIWGRGTITDEVDKAAEDLTQILRRIHDEAVPM